MPKGQRRFRGNRRGGASRGRMKRSKPAREPQAVRHIDSAVTNQELHVMNICRFPGFGFPDQLRCVLKYKENGVLFTGSTTPAAQVYRLNSLFDPNLTGTGHQPNYYDQLTAVYQQYCVTAAKMTCTIFNEGTVEVTSVLVYSDVNVSTQSVENLQEARWAAIANNGLQNSGSSVRKLTLPTASIANIMGERNLNSDPNIYTGTGTNPTDPCYGIFKMAGVDGVTTTKVIVNFEILFDCIFKELSPVTES